MTDKRQYDEFSQRRELQNCGWDVRQKDSIAFNSGSETVKHAVCKMLVGFVLREQGYRVDSEVSKDGVGDIDVVGYGNKPPIAVECETSPTEEVIDDKLDRYYHNEPFRECFVLNVSEIPVDMLDAYGWVKEQL